MKRLRLESNPASFGLGKRFQPELRVMEYVSTQKGDTERGPQVRMNSGEAKFRLLMDGELVWIQGPRRNELAELMIDDAIPQGNVALRDVAGVTVSESVTVSKPDLDTPAGKRHFG
ncbi:MAG TPA: hypothetical protein VF042_05225 [Gemmatimonadaceae bacterium]